MRKFLWGPYLKSYDTILELDFSSGFPNLSLRCVYESLSQLNLIPEIVIHLILNHLKSPLISSKEFPTLETYVVHHENSALRTSDRSVKMGLGISPILYVLSVRDTVEQLCERGKALSDKWYADDNSTYIHSLRSLIELLKRPRVFKDILIYVLTRRNGLIHYLNEQPLFKSRGMKLCTKKSDFVKLFGIWLKPYRSLGITLFT